MALRNKHNASIITSHSCENYVHSGSAQRSAFDSCLKYTVGYWGSSVDATLAAFRAWFKSGVELTKRPKSWQPAHRVSIDLHKIANRQYDSLRQLTIQRKISTTGGNAAGISGRNSR